MKAYLLKNGYRAADLTIMTDLTPVKPTRRNIIDALLKLVMSGANRLFFHYSGHGSWEYDTNKDERDRRDESIVPLDYRRAGMITDDQLRGLLTFMKPTSRLSIILDCCHSGTGMDLVYNLKNTYRWVRVRRGRRIVRVRKKIRLMQRDRHYHNTPGPVVMLSGCRDKQYSADAYEEGEYQGAMTFCLLQVLEANLRCTWAQLIAKVQYLLRSNGYKQIPNLTSGRPLSLRTLADLC